ncbi:MAG: site-specific integrase [Zhongshania sp.]|uniref:tyrosine-type recombinase/integrase n=1 Tax=Zhongshania sp. TaxID=1971902 RepID=UPI002631E476|nr:site-specific integrase [Zhongshania sp.]MDF1693284.1 site-specific integrase [Zhongshania sp.]MDF1693295.1 site-specific integrase [Zhongshania sp.]
MSGLSISNAFDIEMLLSEHGFRRSAGKTWNDAADRWVMTTSHKADHLHDLQKLEWLQGHFSGLFLSDINEDIILRVSHLKKQESSSSTANRYLSLIRAILRASRDDWRWVHWVPSIKFFPEPEHRVRWLKPNEARRLISELPLHLSAMAKFSLATGLRQSNVSYLSWDQVDLKRRLAWVNAADSKSRRSFAVPLNDSALAVLFDQRRQNKKFVFVYKGLPVGRCSTAAWTKAKDRAKIEDFRWHDWRHTWASWHVQNGTTLYELQELGGWKTLDMVLRYAHLAGDQLMTAAQRIDKNCHLAYS